MDAFFYWRLWLIKKICITISQHWYKKEFDSKPVYDKFFLKTKVKSSSDEVTDFFDKEIPKVDSNHACLAVINLDFALQ